MLYHVCRSLRCHSSRPWTQLRDIPMAVPRFRPNTVARASYRQQTGTGRSRAGSLPHITSHNTTPESNTLTRCRTALSTPVVWVPVTQRQITLNNRAVQLAFDTLLNNKDLLCSRACTGLMSNEVTLRVHLQVSHYRL